jgi:hypothetical protein
VSIHEKEKAMLKISVWALALSCFVGMDEVLKFLIQVPASQVVISLDGVWLWFQGPLAIYV